MQKRNDRLRRQREERGWSQEHVAEKLEVTPLTVQRWEQGVYQPKGRNRIEVIKLFGRSAEELGLEVFSAPPEKVTNEALQPDIALPDKKAQDRFSSPKPEPCWNNVPFPQNPYFTGRKGLLEHLHRILRAKKTVALSQAISGLGGIGKTAAAIEYAYRYGPEYEAVLWVNADSETLVSSFAALAAVLNLPEQHERDQPLVVEAVKRWLREHSSWLLIFDNADDLELTFNYLPGGTRGAVLLTTRAQATGSYIEKIDMEKMGRKDGIDFLLCRKYGGKAQLVSSADRQERKEAGQIWEHMEGLPLALDQAASYLEGTRCTLSDYLDMFETHRKDLLKQWGGPPSEHPQSVAATWLMALKKMERDRPAAAQLLRFCAFLHPKDIPESMFVKGADTLGPVLQRAATDTFAWNEAIAELLKYSLVKRDEKKMLTMHRLVQAVIRDDMTQEDARGWLEQVIRVVDAAFPNSEPEAWPQCELLLPHMLLSAGYIEAFQIRSEEAGRLLSRMASYLQDRARYPDAEPLYSQALHIREHQLGPEHPQVAVVLNGLAELYRKQGKYELAEPLFLRALRIWERQSGPEPTEVAGALTGLGRLYYEQGKYEQAEPRYSQALSIREQQLGLEHPQVAIALKGLGELYRKQGRYTKAEPLFQRAIHIWEQQPGPESPDMADPLNNLAALFYEQGKYIEAGRLFQRALHIWEQRLGPDHPQVAIALNNLAWLYRQQGRYAEAETLYQQARSIWEHHLGPEHYQVAYPLSNLAELYLEMGRDTEAKPLFQRALLIFEQRLGSEHSQVAYPLNGLAELYRRQGNYEEAERLFQRALSIREQQLGPDHSQVAFPLNNLALLYAEQDKYEQAEPLYQRALSIRELALGREHPETAETIHDLARLWERQGSSEKAKAEYARALAIRERALGADHPKTRDTRQRLAALLHTLGFHEEAALLETVESEP